MNLLKNKLSTIPVVNQDVDKTSDLAYIPTKPLPVKNFSLYVVGSPGSGKTSLIMSLFLSHSTKRNPNRNKYYYKFFDVINLISASLNTLPNSFISKIPENQQYMHYSDELLTSILDDLYEGDNLNSVVILDDVIRDLSKSKILSKLYLNRRHITHNNQLEGQGSMSIITTSQKYTLLPLHHRIAQSDIILFRTQNNSEINRIKDELLVDLNSDQQDELLRLAWKDPYSFLYIKLNEPKVNKYYVKFDKVMFD